MVHYRGPRLIRPIINAIGTNIFDRITELHFVRNDFANPPIISDDITEMKSLEKISLTQKSYRILDQDDVQKMVAIIPDQRAGELRTAKSRAEVDLAPDRLFF